MHDLPRPMGRLTYSQTPSALQLKPEPHSSSSISPGSQQGCPSAPQSATQRESSLEPKQVVPSLQRGETAPDGQHDSPSAPHAAQTSSVHSSEASAQPPVTPPVTSQQAWPAVPQSLKHAPSTHASAPWHVPGPEAEGQHSPPSRPHTAQRFAVPPVQTSPSPHESPQHVIPAWPQPLHTPLEQVPHSSPHSDPDSTQTSSTQHAPPLQPEPGQQASPAPPQSAQTLLDPADTQ